MSGLMDEWMNGRLEGWTRKQKEGRIDERVAG